MLSLHTHIYILYISKYTHTLSLYIHINRAYTTARANSCVPRSPLPKPSTLGRVCGSCTRPYGNGSMNSPHLLHQHQQMTMMKLKLDFLLLLLLLLVEKEEEEEE